MKKRIFVQKLLLKGEPLIFFILILWVLFAGNVEALSSAAKKKYPHTVLSDDHHILNEFDLDSDGYGVKPSPPFSEKTSLGYVYWNCFQRDRVSINLTDLGYSSEDVGWEENFGDLKIIASSSNSELHEYVMRRLRPISGFEEKFKVWLRLMDGEKYVCVAGNFTRCEYKMIDGKVIKICLWDFERLKSKKGCDSFFEGDCSKR